MAASIVPREVTDDLKSYDAAVVDLQKSPYADMLPRFQLYRTEMVAWQQFAEGKNDVAVATMRKAADEQDKLGQAEVDLPAREMLGDMLMELKRPREAFVEYKVALTLSPNRLKRTGWSRGVQPRLWE